MGRPVKSVFFGNRNPDGTGGEGVASVALGGTNDSTGYTTGEAVVFSAPQITGGATATGTLVANALGFLTSVTVTSAGSGYTSAPTVAAPTGTLGNLTLTASLTSSTANAISITAYLTTADGGSSAVASDITKQTGSKRYRVANAQGTGVVSLVDNGSPTAGQGYIGATDSAGGTYYVKKLYGDTAFLTPNTGTEFAANTRVQWNITAPVASTSVTLDNN
jgi:hypothetical protein